MDEGAKCAGGIAVAQTKDDTLPERAACRRLTTVCGDLPPCSHSTREASRTRPNPRVLGRTDELTGDGMESTARTTP